MNNPALNRSLELYYIDGRRDDTLTAKMFGWKGHVFKTPPNQLSVALARIEPACAGVHLLLGEPRANINKAHAHYLDGVADGYATNGATAWRTTDTNEAYREWEARMLSANRAGGG